MKKYITGGIAALITLTAICMMTGQSQTSSHQQSVGDAICHQQNQGVIVCPGARARVISEGRNASAVRAVAFSSRTVCLFKRH